MGEQLRIYLDIGSNHNQDEERMRKLIVAAARLPGVHGVKVQLFTPGKLWAPGRGPGIAAEQEASFPWDTGKLREFVQLVAKFGLQFGISVFDVDKIQELESAGIFDERNVYLKISALDTLRCNLIYAAADACARHKMPFHISINYQASHADIVDIRGVLNSAGVQDVVVYSAVSEYPAMPWHISCKEIRRVHNSFPFECGYSDHTANIGAVMAVLADTDTSVMELHFDLDALDGMESEHGHCWPARRIEEFAEIWNAFLEVRNTTKVHKCEDIRADPEDGLRPQKKYRGEEKSQK